MAETQKVRRTSAGMQNAMDDAQEKWVSVQYPQTQAQYPETQAPYHTTQAPVATPAQQPYSGVNPVFSATPDDLLAKERRDRASELKVLHCISYIFAFIALTNLLDLLYFDFSETPCGQILVTGGKLAVGLFGACVLTTKKFTAVKVYAFAFLFVYSCFVTLFLRNVFLYRREMTEELCVGQERHEFDERSADPECLDRAWSALLWKGLYLSTFTVVGFLMTWDYVRKAIKFHASEKNREEEGKTDVL